MPTNTSYLPGQPILIKIETGAIVSGIVSEEPYCHGLTILHGDKKYYRSWRKIDRHNNREVTPVCFQVSEPEVTVATVSEVPIAQVAPITTVEPEPNQQADDLIERAFNVNTRYMFVDKLVDMVVGGSSNSLVITGPGGMGKSYSIFNRLKLNELGDADYHVVKGFSTPKALYRTLHEQNGKIVVFDDCDSVLQNDTATNILKGALDSYSIREISWLTDAGSRDSLPNRFEFNGRVIFISNLHLSKVPQPIQSRALFVDLSMTPDEKIERITAIAPSLAGDIDHDQRMECIELLNHMRNRVRDLNYRTFMKVARIRKENPNCWREMSTYMITA
jgi:hypothetical protein